MCVDLDGGGIDRYLYNYCSRIDGIEFDFAIVDSKKDGILEPALREMGCEIFRVPRITDGIKANYRALKEIMTAKQYDAVHVHLGYKSFVALKCAKDCGIKTRIVHAHIANVPESRKEKAIRTVSTRITKFYATDLAACGIEAAKWVWGKREYEKNRVTVHNNAIETEKYVYSEENRKRHRAELGISEGTLAVGHVGRLCDQKNQLRLLDIYNEIHKVRPDSCLLLVGRGEQDNEVSTKAAQLGLADSVKLLGVRDDIPSLLSAMDVFVFPSKYEGLPFTLIETQCNGLPAVSSDAVTLQVKVSDRIEFLPLAESDDTWCAAALKSADAGRRSEARDDVVRAGYDIVVESKKLKKYYTELIQEWKKR